jgi:hypothetical protein
MLEKAVVFGMGLYYEGALEEINTRIDVINREIPPVQRDITRSKLDGAVNTFKAAATRYGDTVRSYQHAVNDRRDKMAAIGAKADKYVDKSGNNANASEAMVWTASLLETKSFLETAQAAGHTAQATVDKNETTISHHRLAKWGTLQDVLDVTNTPRSEGLGGPDIVALKKMRNLVDWWMHGAQKVKGEVDEQAKKKADPAMHAVGYTADY